MVVDKPRVQQVFSSSSSSGSEDRTSLARSGAAAFCNSRSHLGCVELRTSSAAPDG